MYDKYDNAFYLWQIESRKGIVSVEESVFVGLPYGTIPTIYYFTHNSLIIDHQHMMYYAEIYQILTL